jgi:hypothetical protein
VAVSVSSSATVTSDGTEQTLKADTASGCYELHVDMILSQAGETVVLRLKENVLAAGTVRSIAITTVAGVVTEPSIKILGPFACDQGVTATLQRTAGVARAYPWKLLRVP